MKKEQKLLGKTWEGEKWIKDDELKTSKTSNVRKRRITLLLNEQTKIWRPQKTKLAADDVSQMTQNHSVSPPLVVYFLSSQKQQQIY